ncbi:cell division protein FtsI (penicillin-binding protein 3) [Robbsia andropogonis]|uniref:peptidoglycan D,D-transpeptidase FtsI family protein n=1 Tax=Robbsia andropogonis TaxID=28092 RepID=UPI003D1AB3B7
MKHSVGRGKAGKNGRVDGRIGASGRAAADVLPLLAGLSACSGRPTRSGATHGMRSPMVPGGLPRWRSAVVMALLTLAFIGLGARAFWVQVIDQTFYDAEGRKRFSRELAMPAARGDIVDRHGRLLAMSQPVRTVYAMPSALARPLPADKRNALAALLDLSPDRLEAMLAVDRHFIYLKRLVPLDVAEKVRALGIPEVRTSEAWQRVYPDGIASAQLLGFTDIDGMGQEGIEAAFDKQLQPRPGARAVIRNRLGEIVDNTILREPVMGERLQLTVDARLQQASYEALEQAVHAHGAAGGGAVVLDARTGEVLAMTNWPSFDPGKPRARTGDALRNRVITDQFEPGSTVKPIHVANALERRWVNPETVINVSPGWERVGRFVVRDTMPRDALSVGGVLQYSSNVGMIRLMSRGTAEQVHEGLEAAGFGIRPDLPFPGASSGRLRASSAWSGTDKAAFSYGYGFSVSLLQLARAFTMFGPEGHILPLSLTMAETMPTATRDDAGRGAQADAAQRRLSPKTTAAVRRMLREGVDGDGSAKRARVPHYAIAAKTGTTRKLAGKQYAKNAYLATAVGLAPETDPRYVVAVMIDGPTGAVRGGGTVATPVLSEIMSEALRLGAVMPDRMPPREVTVAPAEVEG